LTQRGRQQQQQKQKGKSTSCLHVCSSARITTHAGGIVTEQGGRGQTIFKKRKGKMLIKWGEIVPLILRLLLL